MSRVARIVLSLLALTLLAGTQAHAAAMPKFVATQAKAYESNDHYHGRAAYARPWGWGTGTTRDGKSFSWFAYSNTDAYLQVEVSFRLSAKDADAVDTLYWESRNEPSYGWVGTDGYNLEACTSRESTCSESQIHGMLKVTIEKLKKLPSIRSIAISEYLQ